VPLAVRVARDDMRDGMQFASDKAVLNEEKHGYAVLYWPPIWMTSALPAMSPTMTL
jgi:hypothetical protein